ncbi:MAG: hypothetical protein IH898_08730 [Planctomycetes bacterium]|nr:hypothetical protein [Planctomycetota bacterium]
MERVDRVDQFVEGRPFADQKLDVVDQQHVDRAILVAEAGQGAAVQRAEKLSGELFGGQPHGTNSRICVPQLVQDGVLQMGLADAGRAEQEQRTIMAELPSDRLCRAEGQLVAPPHNKIVEDRSDPRHGFRSAVAERVVCRWPPPRLRLAGRGLAGRSGHGARCFRFGSFDGGDTLGCVLGCVFGCVFGWGRGRSGRSDVVFDRQFLAPDLQAAALERIVQPAAQPL